VIVLIQYPPSICHNTFIPTFADCRTFKRVHSKGLVSEKSTSVRKLNQTFRDRAMDFSLVRALVSLPFLPGRRAIQPSFFASFFRGEPLQ
jgi:hypothetical protein